jgi:rhodanese-related sulfurtransferase
MKILNIHAGITDNDIYEFMIGKHSNNKVNYLDENIILDKKNWIFLDEINTCNSMGLISEMMTKHTIQGKQLKKEYVFIAACNPYRIINKNIEKIGLVKKKALYKPLNLVYTVNPLPFSLLNFVFNFGNLTEKDEKKYIESMISQSITKTIKNVQIAEKMKTISINAIFESQKFIRNNNDVSSVSLREVRRFDLLYPWFLEFLNKFFNYDENKKFKGAINLTIYTIYCIRIFNKKVRKDYINLMNKIFEYKNENEENFLKIPNEIQKRLADEIDVGEGIAKNDALLKNLFAIFVCIINKIPLFIIGKPGCSKSLSVQLIYTSMKGTNSQKEIFKNYPRLLRKTYQGSLNSTSEGILRTFENARAQINKAELINDNIPFVYFDEMGLAEISKNNPLKVMHSLLEYDENPIKVSFVGISNWELDASKLNRGIYLNIPEPDEEDLIHTADIIAKSYKNDLDITYNELFKLLASSYYKYKNKLKNEDEKYREFHGSRDFYHLIKCASRKLQYKKSINKNIELDNNEIEKIGLSSIERNFGGLKESIKKFKEIFQEKSGNFQDNDNYEVLECIKDNIDDNLSRYLLVITKSSLSLFLIEYILKDKNKEIVLYCQSGERSLQAYKKLIKLQYKNVYNLYRGIDNWL